MHIFKYTIKYVLNFFSYVFLGLLLLLITLVWWKSVGSNYVSLKTPVGGDYFTGLTYARAFAKHLPLPTQGWLPFWNNGVPVVGGYQWLFFYPVSLLSQFLSVRLALDWTSIISIWLFFIAAHLLYFQISKNHLIAVGLTLITITSQAVYYQLFIGGMITGSSAQFYLPLALFFLFRFFEKPKSLRSFTAAAMTLGISSIHHLGISGLFIMIPTLMLLVIFLLKSPISKVKKMLFFTAFLLITVLVGAIGIFPYVLKTGSEIVSLCDNPQCWGIYPYHLEKWLGWLPLAVGSLFILLATIVWLVQRIWKGTAALKPLIPPIISLTFLILYPLAAYIQKINSLANTIFPRRMFWTILILLLVCAAVSFRIISRSNRYLGWIVSFIFLSLVLMFLPAQISMNHLPQFQILTEVPNVIPSYISSYILPKYTPHDEIPDWITEAQPQFRFDTIKAPVIQWWNVISDIPVTRGYTGSFNQSTTQWTYFLQTALASENLPQINPALYANRMSFLIDAYGIGYSLGDYYHQQGLNESLYQKSSTSFRQFQTDIARPIISGTTAPPLLFVGNDEGYATFIRAISTINLNSTRVIPVKGPESLNAITTQDFTRFPYIFLYSFKGDLTKIRPYISSGHKVFLELGSLDQLPQGTDKLLPQVKLRLTNESKWQLSSATSLFDKIQLNEFAQLKYKKSGWNMWTASDILLDKITIFLSQSNRPLLFSYPLEKGQVLVSGMNLPFHLTEYLNPEEIQLFDTFMKFFLSDNSFELESLLVERAVPEKLLVSAHKSTGIYFKETFHSGWTASTGNEQLKIYPAGLNMMYIPLTAKSAQVRLQFSGDFYSWIYFWLTVSGIFLGSLFIIMPKPCLKYGKVLIRPLTNLLTQVAHRLHADEHKNY